MAIAVQPCKKSRNVLQSNRCLTDMEQLKTIVVIQTSQLLTWQIQPTQIKSWPRHIHVASVVRERVWTGFFGNPTAEFRRLKESIRFRTSRPVPRSKESPLLRVCAIKDWLPSHDVYFGLSVRTYMFRDKLIYTLFKVNNVYSLMKPWQYPNKIWAGMNLISCGWR